MLGVKIMRILLVMLLISSCKTARPDASEPQFMTYVQDDPHLWDIMEKEGLNERMLVKRVHDKSWYIEYGFAPSCSKRKQKKYRPRVVEAINRSVNLWLNQIKAMQQYINDGKQIVSQLRINEKKEVFPHKDIKNAYTTYNPQSTSIVKSIINLSNISVVFNCREGRAFMQRYANSINMYEGRGNRIKIPDTNFPFSVLLHEVGHTFGLADTYVDSQKATRAHQVSTGINPRTIGHQPIAIMGPDSQLDFTNYDNVRPTIDDRNGIFWLYIHMHMNELELDNCPPHYQPETFARDKKGRPPTIACRPSRPFLFAMASRNYSTAKFILNNRKERKSTDINVRTH